MPLATSNSCGYNNAMQPAAYYNRAKPLPAAAQRLNAPQWANWWGRSPLPRWANGLKVPNGVAPHAHSCCGVLRTNRELFDYKNRAPGSAPRSASWQSSPDLFALSG